MAKNETKLIGEIINPKNITPTRYSMGVEGKKPPKKKNKLVGKDKKRFGLQLKYRKIAKEDRLQFLISQLNLNGYDVTNKQLGIKRKTFDYSKHYIFPLHKETKCYVCEGKANVRHHVLPLLKGGKNSVKNIVPLCNSCHCKVHPHMRKGAKIGSRVKNLPPPPPLPVLRKPTFDIVVIPPPAPKKV